ncbi:MAG TPA: hypothetical protein VHC95_04850 [Opitutales bacterium]|nr:hypothetical protein [Opitutales bacterium]
MSSHSIDDFSVTHVSQILETRKGEILSHVKDDLEKSIKEQSALTIEDSTKIQIYAVTKKEGSSSDVKEIGAFSLRQLYAYANTPRLDFWSNIHVIIENFEKLKLSLIEKDAASSSNLENVIWRTILDLKTYLSLTPQHSEVVATLLLIRTSYAKAPLTQGQVEGALKAFYLLSRNLALTEEKLDLFYDILDEHGFDLNTPLSLIDNE